MPDHGVDGVGGVSTAAERCGWCVPGGNALGPAAEALANNNLASVQVFILQGSTRKQPLREASCKQHPSGLPAVPA